jgi:hypothetical protein
MILPCRRVKCTGPLPELLRVVDSRKKGGPMGSVQEERLGRARRPATCLLSCVDCCSLEATAGFARLGSTVGNSLRHNNKCVRKYRQPREAGQGPQASGSIGTLHTRPASPPFRAAFVRGSGRPRAAFLPGPLAVLRFRAPYAESGNTHKGLPDFGRPLYGLSR